MKRVTLEGDAAFIERHISRSRYDASPEGLGRISGRSNGTPQPNSHNAWNRGGEDRTLDTLLKRQVLYH